VAVWGTMIRAVPGGAVGSGVVTVHAVPRVTGWPSAASVCGIKPWRGWFKVESALDFAVACPSCWRPSAQGCEVVEQPEP